MSQPLLEAGLSRGAAEYRAPRIELLVRSPVARLQRFGRHLCRSEHDVTSIEQVPVIADHSSLRPHSLKQRSARIRREYVKGRSLDALFDSPFNCAIEYRAVIVVHAKDKASIDH